MKELPRIVAETEVGSKVKVEVWRDGKIKNLTVLLGELEVAENTISEPENNPQNSLEKIKSLGITVVPMSSEISSQYEIDQNIGKVVIIDVEESGPASIKDIKPGSVIKRADRQDIENVNDILKALDAVNKRGSKALLILLSDGKRERFVAINIKDKD